MKKRRFLYPLLFVPVLLYAQIAQEAIDRDVWIPFTKAWETNDAELYNSVHTDDVWRINPGRLLIGSEYKARNTERMQGQETKRLIEFSFETRISNKNNAYEVGYYRITDNSDATPKYFVGRFHVALVKENGKWKIKQDWDTDTINEIKITPESLSERAFNHFQ